MIRKTLSFAALAAAALTLSACGGNDAPESPAENLDVETSAADVQREAEEAVGAAGEYTEAQIAEFRASMQEQLDAADDRIDALKVRMSDVSADARADLRDTIAELEAQQEQLEARLADLGDDTSRAWADVRSGFRSAWSELDSAIDSAASRFEGGSAGA